MKRRITLIAQFKKSTRSSAWALGLLLALSLITLTNAKTDVTDTKTQSALAHPGSGVDAANTNDGFILKNSGMVSTDATFLTLQAHDRFITVGKGTLESRDPRHDQSFVTTSLDGKFTLPMTVLTIKYHNGWGV